jgi:hypothetical protein
VFVHPLSPNGSHPARPDGLSSRFQQLCDQLGVTVERGLYGLRHFGATDLVRAGVDIRTVAGRLGNDPTMALRRYSHFQSDADAAAVQGLANRLTDLLETCPNGHPWTERNTARDPATNARVCKECECHQRRSPRIVVQRIEPQ